MARFRRTLGLVLVCCLLVGAAPGIASETHIHSHTWEEIQKPSCTETGIKRGVCSCGDQIYEYPAALNHDWSEWVTTNAKCTSEGERTRTCKRDSSHKQTETLPKLPHNMTDWRLDKQADCTEPGKESRRCTTCDTEYKEREIKATGHAWANRIVKEAECEVQGLSERYCQNGCGISPEEQAIPVLGHNLGAKTVIKNATCSIDGEIRESCTRCSYYKTTPVPKLGKNQANGHNFSSYAKTKDPSCTAEGQETRTCRDCGRAENKAIPKLPHKSNGVWDVEREATLSQPGLEITRCIDCGAQASSRNFTPRGYRYEVPTSAWGPLASEYPGGGGSSLRLLYLDLSYDSDQRFALVTEDGWLIGFAHVTVANGAVRVSVEKKSEATVMRYRAWGMFPDAATAKAVNYDNSLPFDQAVKGPGESCVIALNMISNYYQGTGNERFSDGLVSPDGEASYGQINELMLQMAEGSEE
ncbi:MAG: hypothetical protein GXY60_13415 [Spirochaetales bacterium]|nr:hypothetical protein [Spirochaetales bacterium]